MWTVADRLRCPHQLIDVALSCQIDGAYFENNLVRLVSVDIVF